MARTVADQFVETLDLAGAKRMDGIVGDSVNGLTDAVRRQGKIEAQGADLDLCPFSPPRREPDPISDVTQVSERVRGRSA